MDFPFCDKSQLNPNNKRLLMIIPVIIHMRRAFFLFSSFNRLRIMLTKITLSIPSTISRITKTMKLIILSDVSKCSINANKKCLYQFFTNSFYNFRAFINKSSPNFHQGCSCIQLFFCIICSKYSTACNYRNTSCSSLMYVSDYFS